MSDEKALQPPPPEASGRAPYRPEARPLTDREYERDVFDEHTGKRTGKRPDPRGRRRSYRA